MVALRILLLIVLAPVELALIIVVALFKLALRIASLGFVILSGLAGLMSFLFFGSYFWGWLCAAKMPSSLILGILLAIVCFLLCPYGLPAVAGLLMEVLNILKKKIGSMYSLTFLRGWGSAPLAEILADTENELNAEADGH